MRFFLFGSLHPIAGGWYFNEPIRLTSGSHEWVLIVTNGRFRALIEGPSEPGPTEFVTHAQSLIQGVGDALGFVVGSAITAEIEGGHAVDLDTGRHVNLNLRYEWSAVTDREPETPVSASDLDPLVAASIEDPLLRAALADLGLALAKRDDTAFYCYRAVESVRNRLADQDNVDRAKEHAWPHLRQVLGFTEDELKSLSSESHPRRHGDLDTSTEAERVEWLRLSREVLRRAIAYLRPTEPPLDSRKATG